MKQIKETWNLVFNWLGNGKKVLMGIGFLLIGFLWNYLSHPAEGLEQLPFLIMLTGGLCLVNALFSKLTETNINPLFFALIYIVIMELGIALMGGETQDFTNLFMIWGACYIFVWALNYALLESAEMEGVVKKIVLAFFETLVGALVMVAIFALPIWLAARV